MVRRAQGLREVHYRILHFIQEYQHINGYPPSIREIGEAIDVDSTSQVNYYLRDLERAKYIQRDRNTSRAIRLLRPIVDNPLKEQRPTLQKQGNFLAIPLIGTIAAGNPLPAVPADLEAYDMIEIPASEFPLRSPRQNIYALTVQGDSMIDALINDGDIVIMQYVEEAQNRDLVAVWFDDTNETTLKRFFREDGYIRLQPENKTMQPIIVKDRPMRIQGKVIMVIRKYPQ